jgi:hypothetical protein
VSWWAGFVLGALGGWALGALAAPRAARLGALAGESGAAGGESDNGQLPGAAAARPTRGRRADGMLLDERLTRRAWERLAERDITDSRVDITTVDGVMYLRGRPRDAAETSAVLEIAETTPGVERVVNELKPLESAL